MFLHNAATLYIKFTDKQPCLREVGMGSIDNFLQNLCWPANFGWKAALDREATCFGFPSKPTTSFKPASSALFLENAFLGLIPSSSNFAISAISQDHCNHCAQQIELKWVVCQWFFKKKRRNPQQLSQEWLDFMPLTVSQKVKISLHILLSVLKSLSFACLFVLVLLH